MNPAEIFMSIKVLEVNPEAQNLDSFLKGMKNNFFINDQLNMELEALTGEHTHHDECGCSHEDEEAHEQEVEEIQSLCNWVDLDPQQINQLEVGRMFKGILPSSIMYTYQIVGRSEDGRTTIWYPIDSNGIEVYCAWKFDFDTAQWDCIAMEPVDRLSMKLFDQVKNGDFIRITDVSGNPQPVFTDMDEYDEEDPRSSIYFIHENEDECKFIPIIHPIEALEYLKAFTDAYGKFSTALENNTNPTDNAQ